MCSESGSGGTSMMPYPHLFWLWIRVTYLVVSLSLKQNNSTQHPFCVSSPWISILPAEALLDHDTVDSFQYYT
jgi:hypothetical protein